jgi:hypothetical protein
MWSVQQLTALVSYKKLKTDNWPQLKTQLQVLEKWEEVKNWTEPLNYDEAHALLQREADASNALLELVQRDAQEEIELHVVLEYVEQNVQQ